MKQWQEELNKLTKKYTDGWNSDKYEDFISKLLEEVISEIPDYSENKDDNEYVKQQLKDKYLKK